jgi:repressor LexA
MKLTDQQGKILQFIVEHGDEHGYPPSRQEICTQFGFKSSNAAESHLRALEKKGAIAIAEGKARGITVYGANP